MGLKGDEKKSAMDGSHGSNRTIVGLKEPDSTGDRNPNTRSNRTIVGLKGAESDRAENSRVGQQSHHCGIESILT